MSTAYITEGEKLCSKNMKVLSNENGTDTEICHFHKLEFKLHFDDKFLAVYLLSRYTI